MVPHTPEPIRTATLFPYHTLFRSQYPAAEDMPIGVDVGGPGDDAQYRVARAVGGRAFGHGFKSGSSAKGSSIDSSWPLPLDSKTSPIRSEEHTSELQSLMRRSYAVLCLKKKTKIDTT